MSSTARDIVCHTRQPIGLGCILASLHFNNIINYADQSTDSKLQTVTIQRTPESDGSKMAASGPAKAQTLRQAKKAYKVGGPSVPISEQDQKRLERQRVLEERADEFQEKERRRVETLKRKAAREEQEREARKRAGIGLATQMAGYSHSQKTMKTGMERFVGFGKFKKVHPLRPAMVMEESSDNESEPWSDDDDLNAIMNEQLGTVTRDLSIRRDSLSDSFGEGLDDESMAEAVETAASNTQHQHLIEHASPRPPMIDNVEDKTPAEETSSLELTQDLAIEDLEQVNPEAAVGDHQSSKQGRSPKGGPRLQEADMWADFFASNTQIAKEITPPKIVSSRLLIKTTSTKKQGLPRHANNIKIFNTMLEGDTKASLGSSRKLDTNTGRSQQNPLKHPSLHASYVRESEPVKVKKTDRQRMPPPPPSFRPSRPSCFLSKDSDARTKNDTSTFEAFGLSTQLVHELVDDDNDIDDSWGDSF